MNLLLFVIICDIFLFILLGLLLYGIGHSKNRWVFDNIIWDKNDKRSPDYLSPHRKV